MIRMCCNRQTCPLGGCPLHPVNHDAETPSRDMDGTSGCAWVYSADMDDEQDDDAG